MVGDRVDTAAFECIVESGPADIVAMDFFDDQVLAVALRPVGASESSPAPSPPAHSHDAGRLFLALVDYASAEYAPLRAVVSPSDSREQCALDSEVLGSVSLPVRQSRELRMRVAPGAGEVYVAVNGRVGRRVGCVYASATGELETFDLEGEEEGEDEDMQDVSY